MSTPNTRTLTLPDGGTLEIPLPGSDARFIMRPNGVLSASASCPNLASTVLICVVIGVALGIAGTAIYLRHYGRP